MTIRNHKLITAIILTHNEEIHINRCISSLKKSDLIDIVILDSFSSDKTLEICRSYNIDIYQNKWHNYSTQFNYALNNCSIETDWVLRIDADEYLDNSFLINIEEFLNSLPTDITGVTFNLKRRFLGHDINYGNYNIKQLRLFKYKIGGIEDKNMDEHIVLSEGKVLNSTYSICDDNLKGLEFFITKHIGYARREALDTINKFNSFNLLENKYSHQQNLKKRMFLKYMYIKFPLFVRPFIYFFYRYIIRLGFLDGKIGFLWNFMQGLWYRILVDYNIYLLRNHNRGIKK